MAKGKPIEGFIKKDALEFREQADDLISDYEFASLILSKIDPLPSNVHIPAEYKEQLSKEKNESTKSMSDAILSEKRQFWVRFHELKRHSYYRWLSKSDSYSQALSKVKEGEFLEIWAKKDSADVVDMIFADKVTRHFLE